jgi:hypothetical protein
MKFISRLDKDILVTTLEINFIFPHIHLHCKNTWLRLLHIIAMHFTKKLTARLIFYVFPLEFCLHDDKSMLVS